MAIETRKRSGALRGAVAVMAAAGSLLWVRRHKASAAVATAHGVGRGRRGPDDGGGLAGVREPRRPIPPTLVDAGAPEPDLEPG